MIRLHPDGPYRTAAVDEHSRTVATAVLGLFGWSLIGRYPQPGHLCTCEPCRYARGWRNNPGVDMLRQTLHPSRDEAERHLLQAAQYRLEQILTTAAKAATA